MKLWKKILIGIVVLTMIGIGLIGFGVFEAKKAYTEKIEPDMKRYVTMTRQEQDEYVLSKLGELYTLSYKRNTSPEGQAALNALQNDPAIRQTGHFFFLFRFLFRSFREVRNTVPETARIGHLGFSFLADHGKMPDIILVAEAQDRKLWQYAPGEVFLEDVIGKKGYAGIRMGQYIGNA